LTKVIDDGMIEIVNVPTEAISVPEVLPQRSKKRSIECPDVLSVAMKSARIDEGSEASDAIVITVPDSAQMAGSSTSTSLVIDNEFIMIDDENQNDMQETLKINHIWSESNNKEKEPKASSNDDIIVIDDDEDDVDLSEKEELNEDPTKQVIKESIMARRMNSLFTCNKCSFKGNTSKIIISHMKAVHNAEQNVDCEDSLFKITPELPNEINHSVNSLMPQQNEQQNASLKRKHSTVSYYLILLNCLVFKTN